MASPLLQSKLFVPRTRRALVPRPRLIERLNAGLSRKVSLISAPAGFGKTTLVSAWIATCGRPAAWLSLDAADNERTRFLVYLVAALRTVAPEMGDGLLEALNSPQPPASEAILTPLLNEIALLPDAVVLVLDDYHVIESHPVDRALSFLLEYLPPQMHLVITTREDPQLPLARMRVQGDLTEVRVADLRFTHAEAAAFLHHTMELELSSEEVAALEARTEGWIAGLQMAALSIRGREDASGFIRAFAGDHRYIVDYLVEEVLQRQPDHVRSFLLQTSILDRLSGPLCDAVTGDANAGSNELLEALERGNLFVVPLDDRRQWYRYHHLFADVLQARLMKERPDQLSTLHRRASDWYAASGSTADAVRHALAAKAWERAAELIERAWSSMDRRRQSARWLHWAKALPEELFPTRPVLSAGYGWALLESGALDAAEGHLQAAERWLDNASRMGSQPDGTAAGMVVADEEEFRRLPATLANARAYRALALGDVSGAVAHARRALDLSLEGDHLRRGIVGALLGLALWSRGELEAAHGTFAEAMARFERAGNVLFAITGTYILAEIRLAQGRLHDAIHTYEQALRLAEEQGQPTLRGTAELHLGLSTLLRERGDGEAATEHLRRSEELGEQVPLPRWTYHWCLARARLKEEQGELEDALDLLDEAERHYIPGPVPDLRPVAARKAQVWLAQGRLADALDWAREQGLSSDDELSYRREFEHLTLARVLLGRYRSERVESALQAAVDLLARLLQAAEEGGRRGSMIEILVLQALAHEAQGDPPAALKSLEHALALAEPGGFFLRFVREGAPMARLLSEAAARGVMPTYTRRLLAAFDEAQRGGRGQSPPSPAQPLIEPLSPRELEVLGLVAQGLSNREIGERLFLALNTVKGHNRNIFGKLQVRRRTEAVARARELGLL